MAILEPPIHDTLSKIYEHYENSQELRRSNGIGISTLGDKCERKLWLAFRWASPIVKKAGKMARLLNTGHREEERMFNDLRAIGCEVHTVDPSTGKQFRVEDMGGHISGYIDGAVLGLPEAPKTWHLCETKTSNRKNFTPIANKGVREGKPEHFIQCQMGMGLASPRLERALYLVHCKDNEDMYAERIPFEPEVFLEYRERGRRIVNAQEPPPPAFKNREKFPCGWCDHAAVCYGETTPEVNCRTCLHSTPKENGTWTCAEHFKTLSKEEQEKGCGKHLFIPALLPLELVDYDSEMNQMVYTDSTGTVYFNKCGGSLLKITTPDFSKE